jgi:putative membrane protein
MNKENKMAKKATACVLVGALGLTTLGIGGVLPATTMAAINGNQQSITATTSSNYTKTQVVYAKGSANGDISGVYVVNSFTTDTNANLQDSGRYSSITNLTNTAAINSNGDTCSFTSNDAGEFMYQGDLSSSTKLPWDVSVSYELDGKAVNASELAGKSGALTMKIEVEPTGENDELKNFSDNYLVQATAKLDNSLCSNIVADGATSAQSSGDTQLSYMVFPGKIGEFTITADVKNFEFDGLTVVGVPLSIALDVDDSEFGDATNDLTKLKEAIEKLNDGASELAVGSNNVSAGLSALSSMSDTLTNGSNTFANALGIANNGAASLDDAISGQLASGVQQLSAGSETYAGSLNSQAQALAAKTAGKTTESAKADYAQALTTYTQTYTATYTQIYTSLIQRGQDATIAAQAAASQAMQNENVQLSLNSLNEKVQALAELSGNLGALQALTSAKQGYSQINNGISDLNSSIGTLSEGSSSLASGLQQLNSAYSNLISGISQYTSGTDKLASNYPTLNSGISSLNSGTSELQSETSDIDKKMVSTIKDKLTDYLNPTFTMTDFVNGDTDHIKRVQFVYMTDAIEAQNDEPQQTDEASEDKNFIEKLVALFAGE